MKPVPSPFDDYATEVESPRADLAANGEADKQRRKMVRRLGFGVVAVFVLAFAALGSQGSDPAATVAESAEPVGKAEAMRTVKAWLDGDGTIDVWLSAAGYPVETHQIAVTIMGVEYVASVPVSVGGSQPVAVGEPSLSPVVRLGVEPEIAAWDGDPVAAEVSGTFNDAVLQWVAAYTSGDPERLRQAVGDPDPTHRYVPLTDWEAGAVSQVSPVVAPDAGFVLTRISFSLSPATADNETPQFSLPVQLDLLVADAATAVPRVVAWGPNRSGQQLVAFQNAVVSASDPTAITPGPDVVDSTTTVAPATTVVEVTTTVALTEPPPPETPPSTTPPTAPPVDPAVPAETQPLGG